MTVSRDRAGIVATTVLGIVRRALLGWFDRYPTNLAATHAEIETLLREEFADVARQTLTEIRREDE